MPKADQRRVAETAGLRIDRGDLLEVIGGELREGFADAPPAQPGAAAGEEVRQRRAGADFGGAQLGSDPPKPLDLSTRRLKAAIQRIVAGSARSGAWILTSSSPETPVAS